MNQTEKELRFLSFYLSDFSMFLAGENNFIKSLVNFDKDNISDRVLKRTGHYCRLVDFQPEIIGKVSLAAKSLCMWVRAMEVRGRSTLNIHVK